MTGLVPVEAIVRKIVIVRGEKVLLDRDLAELYGVETKQLKRAVRRNIERFHVSFDQRGALVFKAPIWHLKAWSSFKVFTDGFH